MKNIKNIHLIGIGGIGMSGIAEIMNNLGYNITGSDQANNSNVKRLKKNGIKITAYKIAQTWFVKKDKSKYFYLCEDAGKATSIAAADNALIAMKNWSGLENLKNIKNPTLIIWGDQDKAYNFNQVDTLNKNIPNSELKIIEGCSHNVHLEKPDEFNEVVKYFLAEAFKI